MSPRSPSCSGPPRPDRFFDPFARSSITTLALIFPRQQRGTLQTYCCIKN